MRITTLMAAAVMGFGLTACPAADVIVDETREWRGTLEADDPEGMRAAVRANSTPTGTAVAVSVAAAPTNSTIPWHVHRGSCGAGGEIVGDPGAYPNLRTDTQGAASARHVIPRQPLMRGGDYSVNFHRSPDDLGTVVGCVNLR